MPVEEEEETILIKNHEKLALGVSLAATCIHHETDSL
jgi:hypothetical protein